MCLVGMLTDLRMESRAVERSRDVDKCYDTEMNNREWKQKAVVPAQLGDVYSIENACSLRIFWNGNLANSLSQLVAEQMCNTCCTTP